MTNVQLSGRLPGNETNGLEAYYEAFLEESPPQPVLAVVQIERKKWSRDDVTEEHSAAIRITRIEPAEGETRGELEQLLVKLTAARTGDQQLDIRDNVADFPAAPTFDEGA